MPDITPIPQNHFDSDDGSISNFRIVSVAPIPSTISASSKPTSTPFTMKSNANASNAMASEIKTNRLFPPTPNFNA